MVEIKKSNEPKDYKERFEFVLTTGGNIICQRYFRINNFNPKSLKSYDLTSAIRNCAAIIDRDLKEKTHVYLSMYAPKTFNSEMEMVKYFSNERNRNDLSLGEGFVVRGNSRTDYIWDGEKPRELGSKFDDGEITEGDVQLNKTSYVLAFKVDGRSVCSYLWEGYYPKFVRDKIDLSNKRGKVDEEDKEKLSFEQYLLYRMVENKSDLVYGIIKNICKACSYDSSKEEYITEKDEIYEAWNNDTQKLLWRII